MRHIAFLLLLSLSAVADEPPTFISDPDAPKYQTGAVKPLTAEQKAIEKDFIKQAQRDGWTFDFDVRNVGKFPTGRVDGVTVGLYGQSSMSTVGEEQLKPLSLEEFGELPPIKDQGTCGSCVYFALTWAFEASNWLRGHATPILSPRHLMNCSGEGIQCNGAWATGVSEGLIKLGGLVSEDAYPYRPVTGRCQVPDGEELHGRIESAEVIPGTPRDILYALHQRQAVAITIGANGSFMAFKGGVYNACSQTATNHEMVIDEVDCEGHENPDGSCKFDENGNLPPGVGSYGGPNSWGLDFGDNGRFKIKITDKNGRKCNRIAEEALVLHTGIPLPPEGPVEFDVANNSVPPTKVHIVVEPGEIRADAAKSALAAIGYLEVK
jgi:hypothetical protein